MTVPILTDLQRLLRRLAQEERERQQELARLEDRVRRFEDIDRPAYESWLRLEFGPEFETLARLTEGVRAGQLRAQRVNDLVERQGLHPREALYVVTTSGTDTDSGTSSGWDPDEAEARRRAKLERKRMERRQARRARSGAAGTPPVATPGSEPAPHTERRRTRIVRLYRALARQLHPDSPTVLRSLTATRMRQIWTEVQTAYEALDLDRLLGLSAWLDTMAARGTAPESGVPGLDDEPPAPLLSLDERHQRLRALRRACRALERRLARLETDPAWNFEHMPERRRRALRVQAAAELDRRVEQLRELAQSLDDFFASIGSPRRPRHGRRR